MSPTSTILISASAATAGLYVFHALITNRKGSERSVAASLERGSEGAWTFVAMQYYFGILNRTYLVFVTETQLAGAKVKGAIAAPRAPDARWKDPLFYVSPSLAAEYGTMDVGSADFLARSRANFHIERSEIRDVEFSKKPKWGMASVPYSGRIFLHLKSGATIELILLGDQDGAAINRRLQTRLDTR
jgi:hypothetical protein